MGGPPRHADREGQRPGVGDEEPSARRLGDDRDLAAVPSAHRREGAEPAVLLADDLVDRERPLDRDTGGEQGARDREVGGDPRLHVDGAAPVDRVAGDPPAEGAIIAPLLQVADRHDVDVPLEDERRLTPALTPTSP